MANTKWESRINFLSNLRKSVAESNIAESNCVCEFTFDEFKESFLKPTETKRESDHIVVGIHPPSVSPNFSIREIVRETTTITEQVVRPSNMPRLETSNHSNHSNHINQSNNVFSNQSVEEPPSKKRKYSDWKTGNNKSFDEALEENSHQNKRSTASKMTKAVKRHSAGSNSDEIPPGLESCFDPETGSLVKELQCLDPQLVRTIGFDLMDSDESETGITFKDIAGLSSQKKNIEEAVIWPLSRSDIFEANGLLEPPKGVLLFGPPGTGKTMIAKAIANESGANFFAFSPSTLQSKWLGESSKLIKTMFTIARYGI